MPDTGITTRDNTRIVPYEVTNPITTIDTRTNPIDNVIPRNDVTGKITPIQTVVPFIIPIPPLTGLGLPTGGAGGGGSFPSSRGGGILSFENRYLYGEGIGLSDFASGLNFGRASPRHHAKSAAREPVKQSSKRFVSTGRINFRGRGR